MEVVQSFSTSISPCHTHGAQKAYSDEGAPTANSMFDEVLLTSCHIAAEMLHVFDLVLVDLLDPTAPC
eukprot:m.187404 g.187404  ORF g.187404 m.187404 type:complete len:68 (+) comp14773_c0_seq21:2229-2432(+)